MSLTIMKISKTWSVQVNKKMQASITTTHLWIQLDKNRKLQEDAYFSRKVSHEYGN